MLHFVKNGCIMNISTNNIPFFTKGVNIMLKTNEMKKIAKGFANGVFGITIITKSIFVDGKNIVCNGFDNEYGNCKELYFDFENLNCLIKTLSGVCLHDCVDYSKQFKKYYENYFIG